MTADAWRQRIQRLAAVWAALVTLMLLSLGSAYLPMGRWNVVAGLGIAALKSAIVLWWFMDLASARALLRVVAAVGLFMLALLVGLTEVDYGTRLADPATMQPPQQLRPLKHGGVIR